MHETPLTLVQMIFNPFEKTAAEDCAIRCLDGHGVRILVSTKKKIIKMNLCIVDARRRKCHADFNARKRQKLCT